MSLSRGRNRKPRGRPQGIRSKNRVVAGTGSEVLVVVDGNDLEPIEIDFAVGDMSGGSRYGRVRCFTIIEAAQLAKAWVTKSKMGPQQRQEHMWGSIQNTCTEKYGFTRSINALRCFGYAFEGKVPLTCSQVLGCEENAK